MMIRILWLSIFLITTVSFAAASDSCKVFINNKIVFNSLVDQSGEAILLPAKAFKKNDCLWIAYKAESVTKGWRRYFYLDDSTGLHIKTIQTLQPSAKVSVKASVLNRSKMLKQPVFLSTMLIPVDKNLAARVRVRRVFICRINWK